MMRLKAPAASGKDKPPRLVSRSADSMLGFPVVPTDDTERWRKMQGISAGTRVFIVTGIYPDVRDALVRRGWKQNPDEDSAHFDMKWSLKSSEIKHPLLHPQQLVNHFKGAGCITTKAGLLHTLRGTHFFTAMDQLTFYPRAYDLGDAADYADFVDDFRQVEAEKVLRLVAAAVLDRAVTLRLASPVGLITAVSRPQTEPSRVVTNEVIFERLLISSASALNRALLAPPLEAAACSADGGLVVNPGVLEAALSVSSKRCREWSDDQLDASSDAEAAAAPLPAVTASEWEVLRYCSVFAAGGPVEQAPTTRAREEAAREKERLQNVARDLYVRQQKQAASLAAAGAGTRPSGAIAGESGGGDGSGDDGSMSDSDSAEEENDGKERLKPGGVDKTGKGAAVTAKSAVPYGLVKPSQGAPSSKRPENGDDFNNGTGRASGRDRSAVASMQLKTWRERLARGGAGEAAECVYSESVGDPAPTTSAAASPALGQMRPLTADQWHRLVACIGRINEAPVCQSSLNAGPPKNIWIIKPAGKSRGRGIECSNSLAFLLNNRGGEGRQETQWVVQKYIERPLTIHGLKWDIRQWVLVSSWNPLTVWVYDRCYLRFCCYPFELDNLSNRYIHLSNNSIQKHSAGFDGTIIDGNMWHVADFAAWLQGRAAEGAWDGLTYLPDAAAEAGDCNGDPPVAVDAAAAAGAVAAVGRLADVSSCGDVWGKVLAPQLRRIIAGSLQAAQDKVEARPRGFEVYGYDFMCDARLTPWLIEINSSPDFSYSTAVTEALVPGASEDTVRVVVDHADWLDARAAAKAAARKAALAAAQAAPAPTAPPLPSWSGGAGAARRGPLSAAAATSLNSASVPEAELDAAARAPAAAPEPDTGGWKCIFRSPVTLSRTMTCTAHGIVCVGNAVRPPQPPPVPSAAGGRQKSHVVAPLLSGSSSSSVPSKPAPSSGGSSLLPRGAARLPRVAVVSAGATKPATAAAALAPSAVGERQARVVLSARIGLAPTAGAAGSCVADAGLRGAIAAAAPAPLSVLFPLDGRASAPPSRLPLHRARIPSAMTAAPATAALPALESTSAILSHPSSRGSSLRRRGAGDVRAGEAEDPGLEGCTMAPHEVAVPRGRSAAVHAAALQAPTAAAANASANSRTRISLGTARLA